MTPNSTEFVVAWFALAKLGAVTVPVNTSYKGKFLDNVANNCGAEICISHPDFLETWLSSEDNCPRSEEHTSELQSLMRISYAVFCLKKKKQTTDITYNTCTTI